MFITRALCAVIVAAALIILPHRFQCGTPDRPSPQGLVLVGGCPEQAVISRIWPWRRRRRSCSPRCGF